MAATDPEVALGVEVAAVRWRAPGDDFAVLAAVTDAGEEVTLTGALAHVHEGEALDVRGAWREHPRHGRQLHVEHARLRGATSAAAIEAYLASVRHVGPRGAAWLVARHGPEAVLDAIDRDPRARLREVPGIGARRIAAAARSWEEQHAQRAVRLFLDEHGVAAAAAGRIARALGPGALDTLRADPYAVAELDGVGFATADALARALGTPADAPSRLDAGLLHALREAEADGHCHLPRRELAARARRLLGADAGARTAELVAGGRLVAHDDDVADPALDRVERRLARRARELADAPPALRLREPERPAEGAFVPSDTQWSVVELVLRHRLVVLTGGPGTGKTSSMRALVDVVRGRSRTVRLCAPTGKAARRLGEATGAQATTIHRLLEWVPGEGFARGADDPIPGTDVLIVDEASMLSVRLADALLAAVGPRTHVLLVGDVDQLAPVGPGRVLEDLIASGVVPTVRLTEVFRQAARSLIVRAAHAIDRGEEPPTVAGEDDVRDFFRVVRDDPGAIFGEVVSLAAERLPAHYGLDPRTDVLVLAPMHKGPVGVDALNDELRRRLNPGGAPVPGTAFRVGDRLIQTRNDHERELMNGELALLAHHDDDRDALLLDCDDGRTLRVPVAESGTLRLAYAISVHKAQGSQAPAVVVPVWRGHHVMLTRNLVYTAVTRAERACVLVGDRHGLRTALARPDAGRRFTRLSERVASSGGRRPG
ncbi:MAG TPA: ATP-dependent RecD-like DNA helicase [Solirubrobacteraceae bacterium]|nr:ATP-dependent RecD-like DNA helicase [Solirubrobacteraceae bacterium]